jgi:hypothetical protein
MLNFGFISYLTSPNMGYYIRILGIIDPNILISEIAAAIEKEGLKAKLSFLETENPNSWSVVQISNNHGDPEPPH